MLTGRDAESSDQADLDSFLCAPAQGETYARDVQEWVSDLLRWRDAGVGRRVRVYTDETGIVAVVAWRHLLDGEPGSGFFLYLLAVRQDRKREKIGSGILMALRDHLGALEPGATIAWMVDPRNTASVKLSGRLADDEPRSDAEWPHYLEFTASLPDDGTER